jgi:hypothetical protein
MLLCPVQLNVAFFRLKDGDEKTVKFLDILNKGGNVFFTPGAWDGRPAIRAAFSNWMTGPDVISSITAAIEEALEKL